MNEQMLTGGLGLLGLFLLIAMHVPIGVSMAVIGTIGTVMLIGYEPAIAILSIETSSALSSEGLAIIAMFLLMGNVAHSGGLAADLYRLFDRLVGHFRGGLAFVTIAACAGFGAVSGSSVATAATMVRVALPEMRQRGYSNALAAGTIASGGTLGMIIPPSLVLILYGVLTENSIIVLFLAAIVPGLLAVAFYFLSIAVTVRLLPGLAPVGKRHSWRERGAALRQGWGVVALVLAVSGGIYSGIFSVSEAAAVGTSIALIITWLRSRLTSKRFYSCLVDTAASTCLVFVIIIGASVFSYFATLSGLPAAAVQWINSLGLPPLLLVSLILLLYVLLGAIFDSIAAMVLTLPIVYPLIIGMGYDPIWWGVVNVVVMELGMITPPFGINVFVIQSMAKNLSLGEAYKGVVPFIVADLLRLTLLVAVPSISLWLPRHLGWM